MQKKKAIIYVRVSTDEQAEKGFSLPAQQIALEKYCKSNNIEVAKVFSDDYSAWEGFDRPGYKMLRQYIAANKNAIDYILVTQWSRFSRNMTSSLNEIKDLNSKKIEANAIEQWIDFSIPETQYMLAMYLVAPQIENDRLSLRVKAGMRQGVKEGRWLWKAPKGYKNNTVTKLMEIDEKIAPIIQWCFDEYAKGVYTAEEVRYQAKQRGLVLCKQAFLNMLENPLYVGKIPIKASKDEPEQLKKGMHHPIIDDNTFNQVQFVLKGKRRPNKGIKEDKQDALPLRGKLLCPSCGKLLTGSISKGNGGLYPYYHCQPVKYSCKVNFNAKKVHNAMEHYLKNYEVKHEVIETYKVILTEIFNTKEGDQQTQKALIEKEIEAVTKRIEAITDSFVDNNITLTQFSETSKRYEEHRANLLMQHITVSKVPDNFNNYISYSSELLQNISYYYANAKPSTQSKMVGLIFPENITFTGTGYKTTKTNEAFALMCSIDKALQKNSLAKIARQYSMVTRPGFEPRQTESESAILPLYYRAMCKELQI